MVCQATHARRSSWPTDASLSASGLVFRPAGFGRHPEMTAWLGENCGSDGWAMTPSGMRGVFNDAVSIYFLDATLASAFVTRWCAGYRTASGCSTHAPP